MARGICRVQRESVANRRRPATSAIRQSTTRSETSKRNSWTCFGNRGFASRRNTCSVDVAPLGLDVAGTLSQRLRAGLMNSAAPRLVLLHSAALRLAHREPNPAHTINPGYKDHDRRRRGRCDEGKSEPGGRNLLAQRVSAGWPESTTISPGGAKAISSPDYPASVRESRPRSGRAYRSARHDRLDNPWRCHDPRD